MLTDLDRLHQLKFDTYQEFDIYLRGHQHGNLLPEVRPFLMQDGKMYNKFYVKRKRWASKYPDYHIAVIGDYGGNETLTEIHVINVVFSGGEKKILTLYGESNIRRAKHLIAARKKESARQEHENSWEYQRKLSRKQDERERQQLKKDYIKVYGKSEYKSYKNDMETMKMHLEYAAEFDREDNPITTTRNPLFRH